STPRCEPSLGPLLSRSSHFFFFYWYAAPRDLHSFPTRRSSDLAVARAAIEARSHYIDLADGRQFVVGISSLNAQALAAGVTVTSGASSVPALSSAVVDRYLPRFRRLDAIRMGISSGARAPGLATVKG